MMVGHKNSTADKYADHSRSQMVARLVELEMVSLNTYLSTIVLEGCISRYIRLLYWRDASLNTVCVISYQFLVAIPGSRYS